MRPTPCPAAVLAASLLCIPALAQDPPSGRFGSKREPLMAVAVHDLPGLLGAWGQGRLGQVFAMPSVQDMVTTIETGHRRYFDVTAAALDRARAENVAMPPYTLIAEVLASLGWRDLHSVNCELLAREGDTELREPALLFAVEPTEGARTAVLKRASTFGDEPVGSFWIGCSTRQAVLTMGEPPANVDDDRPAEAASAVYEIHIAHFLEMALASTRRYNPEYADRETKLLEGLGLTTMNSLRWRLAANGEFVREEVRIDFDGKPVGLAAAIADGMAPLPTLPAPAGTMVQLRLSLDVHHLVAAIDAMLESEQMSPLPDGFADRLHKVWTGGVSMGLAAPGPGGLTPRFFASIGITDEKGFVALLDEFLPAGRGVQRAAATFGETAVTRLQFDGAPAAFEPSFYFHKGDLHLAESAMSLRALHKAAEAGDRGLDASAAPPLTGRGRQPGFDLVYDEAAIYRALVSQWLPLARTAIMGSSSPEPLIDPADMPDPRDMDELLGMGRGALFRGDGVLTIVAEGTAGGPEMLALLTSYGPLFSSAFEDVLADLASEFVQPLTSQWMQELSTALGKLHARTGGWPASLAELAASEEFAGTSLLLHPIDLDPVDVLGRDGKAIAKTSFRYYPEALPIKSDFNDAFDARLLEVTPMGWQRLAFDKDGNLQYLYTFGDGQRIKDIEARGRKLLEERKNEGKDR